MCRGGVATLRPTTTLYTATPGAWGCCCCVDRSAPLGISHGSPTPRTPHSSTSSNAAAGAAATTTGGSAKPPRRPWWWWVSPQPPRTTLVAPPSPLFFSSSKEFPFGITSFVHPHPPSPEFKSSRISVPRVVKPMFSLASSTKSLARRNYVCSSSIAGFIDSSSYFLRRIFHIEVMSDFLSYVYLLHFALRTDGFNSMLNLIRAPNLSPVQ